MVEADGPVTVAIDKCQGTTLDDILLSEVNDDSGKPIVYVDSIYEAGQTDRSV